MYRLLSLIGLNLSPIECISKYHDEVVLFHHFHPLRHSSRSQHSCINVNPRLEELVLEELELEELELYLEETELYLEETELYQEEMELYLEEMELYLEEMELDLECRHHHRLQCRLHHRPHHHRILYLYCNQHHRISTISQMLQLHRQDRT